MARREPNPDGPPDLDALVQAYIAEKGGINNPADAQCILASLGLGAFVGVSEVEVKDGRKAPPASPLIVTIRAEINRSKPPIWRRLDVRSDLTLADLHQVLQAAFGWWDYHLHRFSAGGDTFDARAQHFLCPIDVEEGDIGIPDGEVTVGELLQSKGDRLAYIYDYGDHWDLSLTVGGVRPMLDDAPRAIATAGRRAAPPEDCGSLRTAEELAEVLEDPAAFDLDATNEAIATGVGYVGRFAQVDVHPALDEIREKLAGTPQGLVLETKIACAAAEHRPASDEELGEALGPVLWFLDRAGGEGLPLTSAGFLKPEIVAEANFVVPTQQTNWGKNNRENQSPHLLAFRESLQKVKVLRKYKGSLLPTRAAAAAGKDPRAIADIIAGNLIPKSPRFDREASVIVLLEIAATPPGFDIGIEELQWVLDGLGWLVDGQPASVGDLLDLPVFTMLRNLREGPARRSLPPFTLAAWSIAGQAIGLVAEDSTSREQ